jgi:hypothetical protein
LNTLTCATRYLFFAFVPLFLSACVTVRHCPIETLQPARLIVEGPKKNIAVCASQALFSDAIMSNDGATGVPADSLIANILFSLQRYWEDAPGYEDARFFIYITNDNELPKTSDFDLVTRLDRLQVDNAYYGQQYAYFEWEAYLYVHYAAKWSVSDKSGALLYEYTDRDLIVWPSGIRTGKAEAVANLPDIQDAWWDMGIALARNCAARIVPQWHTGVRHIYMVNKFPELSQQAYTAMQNDSYGRAFDIWETMLLSCRKSGQKRTKGQITRNMAVVCEFQNRLDQAVQWAQKSANLKRKFKTVDYLNLLRERQQQQKQLDQQTAP